MDDLISINYHIIHSSSLDIKTEVFGTLLKALEANYAEVDDDELADCISVVYTMPLNKKQNLTDLILAIQLSSLGGINPLVLFADFHRELANNEMIDSVFKYTDTLLHDKLKGYFSEIFKLEMILREAITVIFATTYKTGYYNLLKDYTIKSQLDKDYQKNPDKKSDLLKSKLENEFFYLLFSDYVKCTDLNEVKIADWIRELRDAADFALFQERIVNRGIINKEYQDFLAAIKEDVWNVENIRNCVAHNRTPSPEEEENYQYSLERLKARLSTFFSDICGLGS